jgi:hypothetical protein
MDQCFSFLNNIFLSIERYEVKRVVDGKRYAMKEINMSSMSPKEEFKFL